MPSPHLASAGLTCKLLFSQDPHHREAATGMMALQARCSTTSRQVSTPRGSPATAPLQGDQALVCSTAALTICRCSLSLFLQRLLRSGGQLPMKPFWSCTPGAPIRLTAAEQVSLKPTPQDRLYRSSSVLIPSACDLVASISSGTAVFNNLISMVQTTVHQECRSCLL